MLLGGFATHSAVEIRNVADTDCIYMQFHTTNGPAIMTQVYTQLDFGIALSRNIRLTATDLSPINTGAVSLGTASKAWGNGYFSTLVDINGQHGISTTAVAFNETGANVDFKIEGDTNTELFYVDASQDFIGFGTSGPLAFLHVQKSGGGTVAGLTRGQLHFNPVTATNDLTHAITFGAHDSGGVNTNAQAGIYVQSSGSYGTRMSFATSSSFGAGATARWRIEPSGHWIALTDNTVDIGASGATRPRTIYLGAAIAIGTNPAATGAVRLANNVSIVARNAANSADLTIATMNASDQLVVGSSNARLILDPGSADIQWNKALVALGGGSAPTLGTIGGSGPATAAQNSWMRVLDSTGAAFWVPAWK